MKKTISLLLFALIPSLGFSQEKVLPLLNAKAYSDIDMNGFKFQNPDLSNLDILFTSGTSLLKGNGSGGITNVTIGSGLDLTGGTLSATSSGGSVTDVTVGTLPPIFTSGISTSTSTPDITFVLTDAAAHSFLGNNTGASAAPAYVQPAFTDLSGTATNAQIPSTLSSKTLDNTNTLTLKSNGFTFQDNVDNTKQAVFTNVNTPTSTSRTVNFSGAGSSTTVVADTGSSNNFLTAISANGVVSKAQPAFTNISGTATAGQVPDLDSLTSPSADVSLNSHKITNLLTPSSANDATNKDYVDTAVASGAAPHASVRAATTANITLSGAQTIDGIAIVATDRVLVKNQTSALQNGIYVASAGAWARAADMNTGTEVPGSVFVSLGTTLSGSSWATTTPQPITLDTDAVAFTQTGSTSQYTSGSGLQLIGTQFSAVGTPNRISISPGIDISASYVGQSSITTLGTITTGTWNGGVVAGQYGGTGVANTGKTLTLEGNLAVSGSNTVVLSNTGSTNVTLPTSGVLSTLAGFEALTNKNLDSTNFVGLLDNNFILYKNGAVLNQIQFSLSNLSGNTLKTVIFPNGNSVTVAPDAGASNNFLTGIGIAGVITKAQPAFTNLSGTASTTQMGVGSVTQAWDADLDSLSLISGTNTIVYRSAAGTWSPVTIGTGLTFSAGSLSATGGGGGGGSTAMGNSIYVDTVNGNDGTGTRGSSLPFKTISAALAVALSGDIVIVGPGTFPENSGITVPAGVRLAGSGKLQTIIGSTLSDATHAVLRWGNNSVTSGLTVAGTGANSPPIGIMSADTAATGAYLIDVRTTSTGGSGIKVDKTGTSSVNVYNYTDASGPGTTASGVNITSGTATINLWNSDIVVTGTGTGISSAVGIKALAGTIIVNGAKIVTSAANASDNVGLYAGGGTIEAHNVTITRDGTGSTNIFDLLRASGTLKTDDVVSTSGALTYSGTITKMRAAPAILESHPSNPTGTTDATGKMMGLAGAITPKVEYSGSVLINVSGTILNASGIGDGASVQIRYGTGTAPANGDALTGTATGTKVQYISSTTAGKVPFSCNAVITGLTIGTAIWIDLGVAAITGGTASITDVGVSAVEL